MKFLYRGITLRSTDFKNMTYTGVTLKPINQPANNKDGISYASDGNEHGIYMSDNDQVAFCAYGKPSSFGSPINPNVRMRISGRPTHVAIPEIGIVYRINPTKAVNVREPRISTQWMGMYNNGFTGKEWIADALPADSYAVIAMELGHDILHDAKKFNDSYISHPALVNAVIEMRCRHLMSLEQYIESLSENERMTMTDADIALFRHLFGDNGVAYYEPDEIGLWSNVNFARYLLCHAWHNKADLPLLRYASKLITTVSTSDANLSGIIREDYHQNERMRTIAMQRALQNGKQFDPSSYDKRRNFYYYLLRLLGSNL